MNLFILRNYLSERLSIVVICSWLYAGFVSFWFVANTILGDSFWVVAFLNNLAVYLFLPLPVMFAAGLFIKTGFYWNSLLAPCLIFLMIFGVLFLPSSKAPQCPGQTPLTVVTFNRYGFSGNLTLEELQKLGLPDILVLQESLEHQQSQTIQALQNELPYFIYQSGTGLALFSRYPVEALPSDDLQDPDWFVLKALVDTPSGKVTVYDVHMTTTRILGYLSTPGFIPEIIHYTAAARRELTERLMDDMALIDTPIILMGDFNSTQMSDPATMLRGQMTDAFLAAGWGLGHTFPSKRLVVGPLRLLSRMVRIDMIFVSSEFEVMGAWVGGFFGESDHLPVVAQLAWHVCGTP